ncbi:MAG: TM2 domain-containing protein [Flavobacteriales bacterium]|nr:TM2 domain-containing protein [Flavobacteriales bacterium]
MVTIRNHNLVLDGEFTHTLHPKVLYELGKISPEDQIKFQERYLKKKRSLKLAFICLLFFPCTHYGFLGKWQWQLLFWVTLGGGLVWWIVDFFRLKKLVKSQNNIFQFQILRDLHAVNVFKSFKNNPKVKPSRVSVKIA